MKSVLCTRCKDNEVSAGHSVSSAVLLQYNLPICHCCELLHLTLSQSRALITDSDMLVDPSVQSEENPNWRL